MGQLLTHVVCRSFGDNTIKDGDPLRRRLAGECVNAMFWRNVKGLERNRHVVPMPEGLEPISDTYGRLWVDLDSLHKAERKALVGTAPQPEVVEPPPVASLSQEQAVEPGSADLLTRTADLDRYPDPVREGKPGRYTKYKLWDGSIVVGKVAALEAHAAGVNADLERRRLESSTEPSAGTDDETNSAGPEDDERNDSEH